VDYYYGWFRLLDWARAIRLFCISQFQVGGSESVFTFTDIDDDAIQELIKLSGRDPRSQFSETMGKILSNPTSTLNTRLVDLMTQNITNSRNVRKITSVTIPYALTAFQTNAIQSAFSELKINFKNDKVHPHAMAAAVRKCEETLLFYRLNYSSSSMIPKGYDVYIKDIGGNIRSHIQRSRLNIHSCMPVLDVRDAVRQVDAYDAMRRRAHQDKKNFGPIIQCPVKLRAIYCQRKAQCCPLRAQKIMFVHSMYDMSPTDIADAMELAFAECGYGVMLFDPMMIFEDKGVIDDVLCHWEIEREGSIRKKIKFSFENDSSFMYVHDFKNYFSIMTLPVYVSSRGLVFVSERIDYRMGAYHFKITRVIANKIPKSNLDFKIWAPKRNPMMTVTYYDYDPSAYSKITSKYFKKKEMVMPRVIVEKGMRYALSLSQTKFTVNSIYEYLRSVNVRVVVNGVSVMSDNGLSPAPLYELAHAIYLWAFSKRFEQSEIVKIITESIQDERKFEKQTLFERFLEFGTLSPFGASV